MDYNEFAKLASTFPKVRIHFGNIVQVEKFKWVEKGDSAGLHPTTGKPVTYGESGYIRVIQADNGEEMPEFKCLGSSFFRL